MSINVTRWTLLVLIVGLLGGALAAQFLIPLTGGAVAVDDTIIGALAGALLSIVGHYFPRG